MTTLAQFFLNSSSNVVKLETVEISHPSFTKIYRLVRNAYQGIVATLETAAVVGFDYYPLKLTPTGASSDLDQTLQILFGDLGSILPTELDRTLAGPRVTVYTGCCVGAFVDGTGQLVAPPFLVGNGGTFNVPLGAVSLQMGMNDTFYSDNQGTWTLTVNGTPHAQAPTVKPWTVSGGLNAAYPYTASGATGPTAYPVTAGGVVVIALTGTAGLAPGSTLVDGFGDSSAATVAGPGQYIPTEPLPGTAVKPVVIFRTYRSDDLSAPLDGPYRFQGNSIAFTKEGATFNCSAPRLNLSSTGEIYKMDRFPMLRGFL